MAYDSKEGPPKSDKFTESESWHGKTSRISRFRACNFTTIVFSLLVVFYCTPCLTSSVGPQRQIRIETGPESPVFVASKESGRYVFMQSGRLVNPNTGKLPELAGAYTGGFVNVQFRTFPVNTSDGSSFFGARTGKGGLGMEFGHVEIGNSIQILNVESYEAKNKIFFLLSSLLIWRDYRTRFNF